MTECEIRIARRIGTYMASIAEQQVDLSLFQGLGLALAIVYEESKMSPAGNIKPRDLLEWALSLPISVTYPHVREN